MQSDSTPDSGTTPDSGSLISAARDWVLDCSWKEDPEDIAEMSDAEILRGVERHYDGGLAQLAQDGFLDDAYASWKAANDTSAEEGRTR